MQERKRISQHLIYACATSDFARIEICYQKLIKLRLDKVVSVATFIWEIKKSEDKNDIALLDKLWECVEAIPDFAPSDMHRWNSVICAAGHKRSKEVMDFYNEKLRNAN